MLALYGSWFARRGSWGFVIWGTRVISEKRHRIPAERCVSEVLREVWRRSMDRAQIGVRTKE